LLDKVQPLTYYRNIKTGHDYYVMAIATHTETEETMVVYSSTGPGPTKVWVRPLSLFLIKFEDTPSECGLRSEQECDNQTAES